MLRTNDLDNYKLDPVDPWGELLANIAWALRFLTHSMLNAMPGQLVFIGNMLFDLKYVVDWEDTRKQKEKQILKDSQRENSKRREYTYKVGGKVPAKGDQHILRKTQLLNNDPFIIDEVNNQRGTLTIADTKSGSTMQVHMQCVPPFYER